jgi:putative transposase
LNHINLCGWLKAIILDDLSSYIIAWKLCTTMKAEDVTDTLSLALVASGRGSARQRPRLLSDNGLYYVAGDLVYSGARKIVRAAPL